MNPQAGRHPLLPILLVDDEPHVLKSFETTLRLGGYDNLMPFCDSRQALTATTTQQFEMALLDLNMPQVNGEDLLRSLRECCPATPVIVITGINEVETAVRCLRSGAVDYLVKPVERERLLSMVKRQLELNTLNQENRRLSRAVLAGGPHDRATFARIQTRHPKMLAMFSYMEAIAPSHEPVLIQGETGTGKELVAHMLHELSGVPGDFVAVNVAGLDDTMFSDTLFGHRRGAFTDAREERAGMIEQAAGGTLFLDEIGDLHVSSQLKLLRLLQEREYSRLGDDRLRHSDARVLVATNRDLETAMAAGEFRKDLFYRISVHAIRLPPLRERREDIPLLVEKFRAEAGQKPGCLPQVDTEFLKKLAHHPLPGNVRELRSLVLDAIARRAAGIEGVELLPPRSSPIAETIGNHSTGGIIFPEKLPTIHDTTQLLVEEALRRCRGNASLAAKLLGVSRQAVSKRQQHSLRNKS